MLTVLNIIVPLYFLREDRKASQKTTFSKSFKASIVMTSVVSTYLFPGNNRKLTLPVTMNGIIVSALGIMVKARFRPNYVICGG